MNLPLNGCLVLDLSQFVAGPETAEVLGELGADVIKIERPGGEPWRGVSATGNGSGMSRSFSVVNRNKRGMVLDFGKGEGKKVLYRLVERADVLIEGFIPGTAERMSIGYEQLSRINPRLIYAAISGFGPKGPYADKPAFDLVLQGLSGVMSARRYPDGTPVPAPIWVADASVPFMLALAIVTALLDREKTGVGQKLETSLLHAQVTMQATQLVKVEGDKGVEDSGSATFFPYRCSDGQWMNITILTVPQWKAFCKAMDLEYLADDPDYSSGPARIRHRDSLHGLVAGIVETKPAREWLALLQPAGVPCGPVITRNEVFSEPQVIENAIFVDRDQPGLGRVTEVTFPVRFSRFDLPIRAPAPLLGEHTTQVLQEFGFSEEEILALRGADIVG